MRIILSLAILLSIGLIVGAIGQQAQGDVIFTNFTSPDIPPNFVGSGGWISDRNGGTEYFKESASPFTLTEGPANVSAIHWYGAYSPSSQYSQPQIPDADDFAIRFHTDAQNNPASAPFSVASGVTVSREITNFTIAGGRLNVYYYHATFDPVALSSDTDYWLSIMNDTPADDGPTRWTWVNSNGGSGPHAERSTDGGAWTYIANGNGVPGFYLVPEPTGIALLGIGCLALIRRRHRQA